MSIFGVASEHRQRDSAGRAETPDRLDLPRALILWAGAALLVGLVLLLLPSRLVLHWVVPVTDGMNIVCFAVIAALGALDARLRADSASLPAATIGVALGVLWLAHLLVFPGTLPPLTGQAVADNAAAWTYLVINTATPTLLALATLHVARPLTDGIRGARLALEVGLAAGGGLAALALLLALTPLEVVRGDTFGPITDVAGGFGLVPVAAAGVLLLRSHRGTERVFRGIVPALVLSGGNSLLQIPMIARYTPLWYAAHVLSTAVPISLLLGQLNLYSRSVRAELLAIGRLQASFRTAEALASSLHPDVVISELLERSSTAVEADRALLGGLRDNCIVVEGRRSPDVSPMSVGDTIPLAAMPCIEAAVRLQRIQAGPPDGWPGLSGVIGERMGSARQALAVPLVLSHEVVGVLAFVRVRDVPFGAEDLAAVGTIATVAALALRNARRFASAEEVSDAKTLFLNMAAHELRTPLSVVRGYASMLHDGTLSGLPNQAADAVTALQAKSDELARLVEELLMASRLEAGRSRPRCQELELRTVVTAAVARLRPSVELRGARVDVDMPAGPLPLRADPDYLGRILDNLLINAMTYSSGRPWLRVSATSVPEGRAEVSVEDHGVGLRPEDRERIFERFERVEHDQLGFPAGTGLGLYLSRRLAEDMGGSVRLDWSRPGEGSRFVLELPTTGFE